MVRLVRLGMVVIYEHLVWLDTSIRYGKVQVSGMVRYEYKVWLVLLLRNRRHIKSKIYLSERLRPIAQMYF